MSAVCWRLVRSLLWRNQTYNGPALARRLNTLVVSRGLSSQTLRGLPGAKSSYHSTIQRLVVTGTQSRSFGFLPWSRESQKASTDSEVVDKVKEEIENVSYDKVFAVVHISGRQFKITQNDLIVINRIPADVGESIILQKVLLAGSENFTLIGTPLLSQEAVEVRATVIEHGRTAKVVIFKKKRRKNYKRKRGHRQDTTVLRINEIRLSSENVQ